MVELRIREEVVEAVQTVAFGECDVGCTSRPRAIARGSTVCTQRRYGLLKMSADREGPRRCRRASACFWPFLAQRPLAVVARPVARGCRPSRDGRRRTCAPSLYGIQVRASCGRATSRPSATPPCASAAAMCSSAMSSPATKARRPVTFAARSHACAVTLSWCSPSTVCSLAAARANEPRGRPRDRWPPPRPRNARAWRGCGSGAARGRSGFSGSWRTAERSRRHGVAASTGRMPMAGRSRVGKRHRRVRRRRPGAPAGRCSAPSRDRRSASCADRSISFSRIGSSDVGGAHVVRAAATSPARADGPAAPRGRARRRAPAPSQPSSGAQRLGPLEVEQRPEGAQVRAQLARRDPRLVHRLRVAAGAHERVVTQQGGHRLREDAT